MVWPIIIAVAATAVSGAQQYQSAKANAKHTNNVTGHQQAVDGINATRARETGVRQEIAVTRNQRRVQENAIQDVAIIAEDKLKASAMAKVNAAASGTAGGSVQAQLREIERTASQAEFGVRKRAADTDAELERSRTEIRAGVLNRTTNNFYGEAAGPNTFLSALGTGLNAYSTYTQLQAQGPNAPIT